MKKILLIMLMLSITIQSFAAGDLFYFLPDKLLSSSEEELDYFLPDGLLDDAEEKKIIDEQQQRVAKKATKKERKERERVLRDAEYSLMNREDMLSAMMMNDYRTSQKMSGPVMRVAEVEKSSFDDEQVEIVSARDEDVMSPSERQRLKDKEKNKKRREKEKEKKAAARAQSEKEDAALQPSRDRNLEYITQDFLMNYDEFFDGSVKVEENSIDLMLRCLRREDSVYHNRESVIRQYEDICQKHEKLLKKRRMGIAQNKTYVKTMMEDKFRVTNKKQIDQVIYAVQLLSLAQLDCDSRGKPFGDVIFDIYFWDVFFKRCMQVIEISMQDPTGYLQEDLAGFLNDESYNLVQNLVILHSIYRNNTRLMNLFKKRLNEMCDLQMNYIEIEILPDMSLPVRSYEYMTRMLRVLS